MQGRQPLGMMRILSRMLRALIVPAASSAPGRHLAALACFSRSYVAFAAT
jgi:hypothetical protein